MPSGPVFGQRDTDCLYTTVQNISGSERVFGYLGERGKRLAVDEVITVRGDLVSKLGNQTSKRRFNALERSLKRDSIAILATPSVHLFDATLDQIRILALDNDSLGITDPCWEIPSLSSSSF